MLEEDIIIWGIFVLAGLFIISIIIGILMLIVAFPLLLLPISLGVFYYFLRRHEKKQKIDETKIEISNIEDQLSKCAVQKETFDEKLRSIVVRKEGLLEDDAEMKRFGTLFTILLGSSFSPETALRSLNQQIEQSARLQLDTESKIRELDEQISFLEERSQCLQRTLSELTAAKKKSDKAKNVLIGK